MLCSRLSSFFFCFPRSRVKGLNVLPVLLWAQIFSLVCGWNKYFTWVVVRLIG